MTPKNRIILGLFTFGPDEADGARITDVGEYGRALDLFKARGYDEVDTARIYAGGKQEAFTRAAGWKERGLTLATKVAYPMAPGANTADKVVASVETSLADLGTGSVDVSVLARVCIHTAANVWQLLYLHGPVSPRLQPDDRAAVL